MIITIVTWYIAGQRVLCNGVIIAYNAVLPLEVIQFSVSVLVNTVCLYI